MQLGFSLSPMSNLIKSGLPSIAKPIRPINQSKSPKLIDFNTMDNFSITSSYKQSATVTTFKKIFNKFNLRLVFLII